MSVMVLSQAHIDVLATAAQSYGIEPELTIQEIGQLLLTANHASFWARYKSVGAPPVYVPRVPRGDLMIPQQVHHAARSFEYQACEMAGWRESRACRLVDLILYNSLKRIPGYAATEWAIPADGRG